MRPLRTFRLEKLVCLLGAALSAVAGTFASAQSPSPSDDGARPILTLEESVAWALRSNPDLAVFRQQRGVAQASVVIARTYPFNPVWGSAILGVSPTEGAVVTNRVFQQHTLAQEVELRGQGKIRRAIGEAVLSRVEWEIAAQEQRVAVAAIRAFNAFAYQQEKLRVLDDTLRLQEQTTKQVKQLVDRGIRLKAADFLLARSDELEAKAQRGARQTQAIMAWHDLRRVLGARGEVFETSGTLASTVPAEAELPWTQVALQSRPDLRAAHMAYLEADERERLQVVNRFGNLNLGVKSEYNESRVWFVGPTVGFQVPAFNTKRGDILQRQAEKVKAVLDEKRVEIQIHQEVAAATDRLKEAQRRAGVLEQDILPALRKTMEDFDKLFAQGEVDVLRLIDVRRRYLRARDTYLDALWELNQARADLAAAVGDFTLATDPPSPARLGAPTAR